MRFVIHDPDVLQIRPTKAVKEAMSYLKGHYKAIGRPFRFLRRDILERYADWKKISTFETMLLHHWSHTYYEDLNRVCQVVNDNHWNHQGLCCDATLLKTDPLGITYIKDRPFPNITWHPMASFGR